MGFPNRYLSVRTFMTYPLRQTFASCSTYWLPAGNGDGPTVDQMTPLADTFHSTLGEAFKGVIPATCSVFRTEVRWKDGNILREGVSSAAHIFGIIASTEPLPEEDAVVLKRMTGQGGRSKRGRIFVPYVPESFVDSGNLTPAAVTAYSILAAIMKTSFEDDNAIMWDPYHIDQKNSLAVRVNAVQIVTQTNSRRDRRNPKRSFTAGVG